MEFTNILVVDDEENIVELLTYNLEKSGYHVYSSDTGEQALQILNEYNIDLAVLDLMLPGIDGLEILKYIRGNERLKDLPVILLTAKNEEVHKVIGLELGADDYMGKPFGVSELLARIKALLRRIHLDRDYNKTSDSQEEKIRVRDLIINKSTHQIIRGSEVMDMPLKEFQLLYLLASNPERVFTRDYLLEKLWGYDYIGETRTVDVHIRNIRKKLETEGYGAYIKTIRGLGYKFIRE